MNDELRQRANTKDLIVDGPGMISLASSGATLSPGDIIASGTPAIMDRNGKPGAQEFVRTTEVYVKQPDGVFTVHRVTPVGAR